MISIMKTFSTVKKALPMPSIHIYNKEIKSLFEIKSLLLKEHQEKAFVMLSRFWLLEVRGFD